MIRIKHLPDIWKTFKIVVWDYNGENETEFECVTELVYFNHEEECYDCPEFTDYWFDRTIVQAEKLADLILKGWEYRDFDSLQKEFEHVEEQLIKNNWHELLEFSNKGFKNG